MMIGTPGEVDRPAVADADRCAVPVKRLVAPAEVDPPAEEPHDRHEVQDGLGPAALIPMAQSRHQPGQDRSHTRVFQVD